jgi:endoglucanase
MRKVVERGSIVVALALAAASCGSVAGGNAPAADPPNAAAYVRVNQLGYDAAHPIRAYLLSAADETGVAFRLVEEGGAVASTGTVGEDLGGWNATFGHVHAIDIGVADPGSYTIVVDLPAPATSPTFAVGEPGDLFAPLLANALTFYQAQRDGPNVVEGGLDRRPAHLHDRRARVYREAVYTPEFTIEDPVPVPGGVRHDVAGGWFDAGDYIKGIQTESYTAAMLLVALRDFPRLLQGEPGADFRAELRFELKWLLKMWDDETDTLYYQVGFGDGSERFAGDHEIWRLPQDDDAFGGDDPYYRYIRHRPVFRAGTPGSPVSPNLAGRLAAAFALCSQVYRAADAAFADRCLRAGHDIYALADTDPGRLLTFSPFDYYPETEWHSDLELGAVELYRASSAAAAPTLPTEPEAFLADAASWARAYVDGDELGDTLNLYDVSAIAHAELARAMDDSGATGLAVDRDDLVADLERQLDGAAAQAEADPFGFGFPYAAYDGTSHGQGLAITAALQAELTGEDTWLAFGRRQLDVVLGANPWGTSFIVGAGERFPQCVHHQVANLLGGLDGTGPLLLGAAVNGTNTKNQFKYLGLPSEANDCPADGSDPFAAFTGHRARWWDDARSWPTSEPAIDFAATTPLAFASYMA